MTGSPAERSLLGALLLDATQHRTVTGLVSDIDFEDGRLGMIFARLIDHAVKGSTVTIETVEDHFGDWGVLGLPRGVAFEWTDPDKVIAYEAPAYARSVRMESVRRSLRRMTAAVNENVQLGQSPLDVATRALADLTKVIDGAASGTLESKSLAEILKGSDSYDWVIPNLLERSDRVIVTGPEGSGKTTWCRQIAVLSAAGIHPTTFQQIAPVRVLVIDAENTERQWRRAVRWYASQAANTFGNDPTHNVEIVAGKRLDITRGSHLGEIHRLVDRHKPDLLYIGPLYKLVSGAITNDDDASPLIVALDGLRDRGLTLLMEAHAGKGLGEGGSRDLRPRGSAALLGWPEFGLGLRPDLNVKGTVDVGRWRGDRDERAWPTRLMRAQSWPWVPVESI